MFRTTAALLGTLALPAALAADVGVTLRGSPESMVRQNQVARQSAYAFHRTPEQIRDAVEAGELVRLEGNEDYAVLPMGFPVALPEVKLFVERLSAQFREACADRLVVTSLTRAINRQPPNAHPLSVHPAGMAVDLRVPRTAACRSWLDAALLGMEARGLIDATRENRPPHYHVAVFPRPYVAYVAETVRLAEPLPELGTAPALRVDSAPEAGPDALEIAGVAASSFAAGTAEAGDEGEARGWLGRLVTRVLSIFRG
jgi:hypothetical protein